MPPTPPPAVVRPPGWRPDLFELRADECKWPLGDGPFLFCGAKRHNILYPYCEDHLAKAYSSRRDDAMTAHGAYFHMLYALSPGVY